MKRRPLVWPALLCSTFVLAACSDEPASITEPGSNVTASPPGATTAAGWDLPLRSAAQLARDFPGTPCAGPRHREFDFWVGEWNVFGTNDAFFGTNEVTSELDGCLVQEHWISSGGTRGRSLNAFDAETGMWHQDWVAQVANPNGLTVRLRTSGGLEDGTMKLTGIRHPVLGATFIDTWTWTEDDQGNVIQTGKIEVPEVDLVSSFTGVYRRGERRPVEETITPHCQAGEAWGATREADFLVGSYDLSARAGPSVGTATIETDLSDCLFVERIETDGGLRATAFTYYDAWVEAWFRVYVDSEGERLRLRGGFEGERLVLRGAEGTASGDDVETRLTWTPDGADLLQTWEVSRDGGTTWKRTATLAYTAR